MSKSQLTLISKDNFKVLEFTLILASRSYKSFIFKSQIKLVKPFVVDIKILLGTIFILRKGVLAFFEPPTPNLGTFSVHN